MQCVLLHREQENGTKGNNFVVEMSLKPVQPEVYQELGKAEVDYTELQMNSNKLTQLLVTRDHKRYWMAWEVADEAGLRERLEGFPLRAYFDIRFILTWTWLRSL